MLTFDSYLSSLVKRLVHLELVVSVHRLVLWVFRLAEVLGFVEVSAHSMVVLQVVASMELHSMMVEVVCQYLYHNQH